ncbi:hypothetical protein ACI6Q2_03020 [Chitinophagaceae bacterium LWZ2-11]
MEEIQHWKKFFDFEKKNHLFDYKDENGVYIWDIIRYEVYIAYMWELDVKKREAVSIKEYLGKATYSLISLIKLFFKKKNDNLFYIYSRDLSGEYFYDRNISHIIPFVKKEPIIIEFNYFFRIKYFHQNFLFRPFSFFKVVASPFINKKKDFGGLINLINKELQINWTNEVVESFVRDFKLEIKFYTWLLKQKKIKKIFVIGRHKGMFHAAKQLNIPIIEFQHGIVDAGHLFYNYPELKDFNNKIYIPDLFVTFSPFWIKGINYPVKKVIPIGNDNLYVNDLLEESEPTNNILFISSIIFGKEIIPLVERYAKENEGIKIYLKLHPDQFFEVSGYQKIFKKYANIKVISKEYNTYQLIQKSRAVVAINSTVVYEALQAGKIVFLYKKMTYYRHEHIFNHPNLYLIDNANQINFENIYPIKNTYIFFDRFNPNLLKEIL